ncbi:MAG: NAD(P)H-binding protein [Saprospiraceae bacterium]|nr:NAD(P)H-binding protein [Lewinella sp.]
MSDTIKKVSILGCGWLGFPLAKELIKDGYNVLGSTTRKEKMVQLKRAGIQPYLLQVGEVLSGGIGDFFQTDLLLINIPPGRRRPDVAKRYPKEIRLITETARQAGMKRYLFISSTGVYEDVNRVVTEEEKTLVTEGSGAALLACERYLRSLPETEVSILRLAGLVGGERKAGRFLAGKENVRNGEAPVNMVHREDCLAVIKRIIDDGIWGETFNVCADKHPSRRDFYTRQAQKDGFTPPTFADEDTVSYKIVSSQKLKEQLGYDFQYPDPLLF